MREIQHSPGYGLDTQEMDRREARERAARVRQKGAGGFHCPKCDKATSVNDSRPSEDGVRRRRHCASCGHRFSTVERLITAGPEQPKPQEVTAAARRLILRVLANLPREGA